MLFKPSAWIAGLMLMSASALGSVELSGAASIAMPLTEQALSEVNSATGAETLRVKEVAELGDDNLWRTVSYYSFRINDKVAARDYSSFRIGFNDFYSDLSLDFARTLTAEGREYNVSADAVQQRSMGGGDDFYTESSELVFSLPKLAPGTLVEFQFTRQQVASRVPGLVTRVSTPVWYQPQVANDGYRTDPVGYYHYEIRVPDDIKLNNHTTVSGLPKPSEKKADGIRSYQWEWHNPTTVRLEEGMPAAFKLMPYIYSSNQTRWTEFQQWAAELYIPTEDMIASVADLVAGLELPEQPTDEDKVKAVYAWVENNIRYVYAHLGRGGYTPHSPTETLANGYGDCKDQALLVQSMLAALGVKSKPVLIQTRSAGETYTGQVSNIFNHIFVMVPGNKQHDTIWLDTTGDNNLYPGASAGFEGQPALIVAKGESLQELSLGMDNHASLALHYALNEQRKLTLDVKVTYQGMAEQNIRSWYHYTSPKNRLEGLKSYFETLYMDNGQYRIDVDVENADSLFEPFATKATFHFKQAIAKGENITIAGNTRQLMAMFGLYNSLPDPTDRLLPFQGNLDLSADMTVSVEVPDGYRPLVVKEWESANTNLFEMTTSVADDFSGMGVEARFQPMELSNTDYQTFYQQIEDLMNQNGFVLTLFNESAFPQAPVVADSKALQEAGGHTVQQVKELLDQGDFGNALMVAESMLDENDDSEQSIANRSNGELWYLLGTAAGMEGEFDRSDAAYLRASELGYQYQER